jgi:hypothetical protein
VGPARLVTTSVASTNSPWTCRMISPTTAARRTDMSAFERRFPLPGIGTIGGTGGCSG